MKHRPCAGLARAFPARSSSFHLPRAPLPACTQEPHVYAVAAKAYAKLRKEGRNQSILITGESGAGKTENTKFVIKYLALNPEARSDGGSGAAGGRRDNLENRIIGTNPLLEAFGNAKVCSAIAVRET